MSTLGEPIYMENDTCPHCGKHIDQASCYADGDQKPSPGDLSVCIGCAEISKYGDDMGLEKFPEILLDTLEEGLRTQILRAVHTVKAVNRQMDHEKTNGKT